jgi:hypothetical protein
MGIYPFKIPDPTIPKMIVGIENATIYASVNDEAPKKYAKDSSLKNAKNFDNILKIMTTIIIFLIKISNL